MKRIEPFIDLQRIVPLAYSLGLEIPNRFRFRQYYTHAANDAYFDIADVAYQDIAAAHAAAHAAADAAYAAAADADDDATYAATTHAAADAAYSDYHRLLQLDLGKPGTLGEPIHAFDPRLGPLWPDGEPAWSFDAKKQYRELSEKVRDLEPGPVMAPLGDSLKARLAEHRRLDDEYAKGSLDAFAGEHLVTADGKLVDHGPNLYELRTRAEEKARTEGIPLDHLVEFYVEKWE